MPKLMFNGVEYSGGGGGHAYSTTEQEVGTWVDGSTLYEVTYEKSNVAYNSVFTIDIPSNIEILSICGIGRIFLSNRFYYMPVGCVSGASISWNGIKVDAEPYYSRMTVNLNAPSGSTQTYVRITMQYIKVGTS